MRLPGPPAFCLLALSFREEPLSGDLRACAGCCLFGSPFREGVSFLVPRDPAVESALSETTSCVCVIFYLASRYLRPEGPWQQR